MPILEGIEDMEKSDPWIDADGDVGGISMFNGERCLEDETIGIEDNSNAWLPIAQYIIINIV